MGLDPKDRLLEEALGLSADARAEIAAKLIDSLDSESDADAASAWATEIERRVKEVDAGHVTLVPWAEVRARIEAQIKKS